MSSQPQVQDAINALVYHRAGVEREYTSKELTRMEAFALLKYQPAFAGRDILDIGVGTGRTSFYLAPLAKRYEAVDYSPVMVEHLRASQPQFSVRLADMRDLSAFADASMDFVFGSNNVIDAVGEEDRLRTLREFARVLRPGGTLAFSSHNRHYAPALGPPRLKRTRNPVNLAANTLRWLRQLRNHARLRPQREVHAEYALLDDGGHDHACLHYYVSPALQLEQLAAAGLEPIDVIDGEGGALGPGDRADGSASLMYVARKPSC
jgi:SAM-dependent methyltransferase